MTGMGEFLVLKGEQLSTSRVCDCIIFYKQKSYGAALVELKSSYSHADAIIKKFSNTLKIAESISKKMKIDVKSQHLVLLSKNHRNPITNDLLGAIKIKSSGSTHRIHLNKCGDQLLTIINNAKPRHSRRRR